MDKSSFSSQRGLIHRLLFDGDGLNRMAGIGCDIQDAAVADTVASLPDIWDDGTGLAP